MDVCPHCGAPLPWGSTFCPRCQMSLLAPVAAPGSLGAQQNRGFAAAGKVRRAQMLVSLALVALVLVAGGAAWLGFVHSSWGARLRALNEIVFVGGQNPGGQPDDSSDQPTPQLYIIHPDGTGLRQLTNTTNISYLSPCWSPDGSHLAALELADNQAAIAHLVVMDADGSHAHVISAAALHLDLFSEGSASNVAIDSQLIAWSPDGNQLVVPVSSGQYMLLNADGANPHTFNGLLPTWSPDGRDLAYYVAAPVGQNPDDNGLFYTIELLDTQTFQTRQLSGLPPLNAEALAWSPDGHYLAASAFQDGSFLSEPIDTIVLVRLDGSTPALVARWMNGQVLQVVWAPNSQKLAVVVQDFNAVQSDGTDPNASEVWVVNANGSNPHRIGQSDFGEPSWSPDGKRLVYDDVNGTSLDIADTTSQPDATVQALAPSMAFLFQPCWFPLASIA